jgi:hypothetical protein
MNSQDKIQDLQRQIQSEQEKIRNCHHEFGKAKYDPDSEMKGYGSVQDGFGSDPHVSIAVKKNTPKNKKLLLVVTNLNFNTMIFIHETSESYETNYIHDLYEIDTTKSGDELLMDYNVHVEKLVSDYKRKVTDGTAAKATRRTILKGVTIKTWLFETYNVTPIDFDFITIIN